MKSKLEQDAVSKVMNAIMSNRKRTSQNFAFSLLLGAYEAFERGETERVLKAMEMSDVPDIETLYNYCHDKIA
jgi:hypothetical protein